MREPAKTRDDVSMANRKIQEVFKRGFLIRINDITQISKEAHRLVLVL